MMRYQQLRGGLDNLSRVGKYLFNGQMPTEPQGVEALLILREAATSIREELKHPERFNLDGTKREVLSYDSAKKGPYVKVA